MERRLKAALLVPGTAALFMVVGCIQTMPPGECAAVTEACMTADDCCEGLTCADSVCVPLLCAGEGGACMSSDDCCDGLTCTAGVCAEPPPANTAVIPAKTIGLDLVGIHDPQSDAYNENCIGCHGDRTDEVALDGETPAAHATMAAFFGTGNDRCIACHNNGPNFYNFALGFGSFSKGGLREQVDMATVGCANCHGAKSTPSFYAQ